jgi:hypothetical protein
MRSFHRAALPFVGALALLAAGCGSSDQPTAQGPSGTASTAADVSSTPTPAQSLAAAEAVSAPTEAAPASTPDRPISCAADIGESAARKLVAQCKAVSPATRPPCNAANSCAMIRNEVARGCALLGEDADTTPECALSPIGREAAADLVQRFYAAVNAHDYASAWTLWGPDGNPDQTLQAFAAGYRDTRRTHVEIGKVSDVEGGAGSLYVTVPVTVDAELADGSRQRFVGSYDLRQINRGMGRSQGWHIMAARLKPA